MKRTPIFLFNIAVAASMATAQSQVKKETVPGITNLARIEFTLACAGAVTPSAVAEIKKMGFKADTLLSFAKITLAKHKQSNQ
jgi:hypothetical protein